MANGDIKQFGMWKCINSSNAVSYKTGGYWPYSIYYSEYSNGVTLVNYDSSKCSDDPIEWIEYSYNGKTVYIQNKLFFYSISITESLRMCSNNEINIDGVKYKLSFMPKEFWTNLPSSICTLFKTDTSKKFYTNSPFYTDSTSYYYSVHFDGNSFSYDSESIGVDTIDEAYAFVPVLVQDNSSNDGNTVQFGRWITNSGDYIYDNYSEIDLSHFVSVQLDPDYTDSNALTWVEGQVDSHKCYFAKHLLINYMSYNKARQLCNNTYTINGNEYKLTLLTRSQWESLPSSVYSNLQYPTLYGGGTQEYIFTSETSNSYVYGTYRTSNDQAFSTELIPTERITDYDTVSGYVYFAPVLVSSDVPDGTIVEMGMTYDSYNGYNHTAGMETIYPVDGFTEVYDIDDVSIVESLQIVNYDSSYTNEPPMDWVAYNYQNKLYYISRTTFIWGNIQDTFDICNNNKAIYLNGKYYEMTTMPIEFWTGLPSSVKNNMEIVNLNMHTDSEVQVSTSSEGMQTGYRTVSFDTNEIKFVESMPAVPGIQGEAGCAFIPVLVEKYLVDTPTDGSGYQYQFNISMVAYNNSPSDGTNIYQLTKTSYLYTDPSFYSNNNYNNIAKTKNNITFVNSESGGLVTYKVYINNEMHYISRNPVLTYMNSENVSDLLNKLRNFTIDGVTYEIKLLSESQWKILNHRLYRDEKVDTVLNRGHETWDDGSVHETLLTTWMVTSSYGYYSDDTDVDSNYQRAYFQCGWFKDNNYPTFSTTFYNTIGEYGCFYPVIKKYNPNNEKNIEKFGTLQITRSESTRLYSQPINSDYTSCPVHTGNTFTFVSTSNENLKWKWIKTKLNNKIIYISKVFLDADMEPSDIINNMKDITIDGIPYRMRLLSMDEWKSIDKEVLYQIDFGICKNRYERQDRDSDEDYYRKSTACFRTLTSTTYASSGNYEWFGGYDRVYHQRYVTGNTLESGNDGMFPDQLKWGYLPVLELVNIPPTISGSDSNLGDKTQTFSVSYTVDDADSNDILTITEKLNGTTVRTINNAVRNQPYSFSVTTSQFANLTLYETSTIEIIVSDGKLSATRTYTFRKTNTAPVINYTGSDNLGIINSKPTIKYTVTDAEGDEITITERLNGKVLQTYTVSSGTECTVNIPNMSWLGCGNTSSAIEINARDSAGGSSNKTITFTRAIDRIEVITNPIKTDKAVTKISLEVGWNTEGASGQVFVCNNGYDESPTWEDMTDSVGSSLVYNLTNTTKTAAEWGVSVKVIVKKDGGSTGEVSLYSIKGTYE